MSSGFLQQWIFVNSCSPPSICTSPTTPCHGVLHYGYLQSNHGKTITRRTKIAHALKNGGARPIFRAMLDWLMVSTDLKHISQMGSFPQIGVNIKNIFEVSPPSNS